MAGKDPKMASFIISFIIGWVVMTIILHPILTAATLVKFLGFALLVIGIVSLFMPSCSGPGSFGCIIGGGGIYAAAKALGF